MSARFIFSAFADEISPNFDEQLEALKELGIPLLELRGVDGKSFVQSGFYRAHADLKHRGNLFQINFQFHLIFHQFEEIGNIRYRLRPSGRRIQSKLLPADVEHYIQPRHGVVQNLTQRLSALLCIKFIGVFSSRDLQYPEVDRQRQ